MIKFKIWFYAILFGFMPSLTLANDLELYDPEPPADSAFVRIINVSGEDLSDVIIGNAAFAKINNNTISPYRIVQKGSYSLPFQESEKQEIESGKYYSYLIGNKDKDNKTELKEDEAIDNPAKSQIYLYNISDGGTAELYAPLHKSSIIKDVASGDHKSKPINALTLDISARLEGKEVKTFQGVALKRRVGTTFVVSGTDDNFTAFSTENTIAR